MLPDSRTDDAGLWARLMVLAQDGDKQAYHQLLVAIVPYVRAIARRLLASGSSADADLEDAVQEVLLVVHSIRHTYERGRPFKRWLSTIASRRIIDLLRRRSLRDRHEAMGDETAPRPEWTAIDDVDPEHPCNPRVCIEPLAPRGSGFARAATRSSGAGATESLSLEAARR